VFDKSFDLSGSAITLFGISLSPDGTRMYVGENGAAEINQYILTIPYDVSTAIYDASVVTATAHAVGITFNNDGTKLYAVNYVLDDVREYDLSVPYDIETAIYNNNRFSFTSQAVNPYDIAFNTDGTKMFMVDSNSHSIYEYNLSGSYDVTTAVYSNTSFNLSNNGGITLPRNIEIVDDGFSMFIVKSNSIHKYSLTTAYDITSATYVTGLSLAAQTTQAYGFAFDADGSKIFVSG